MRFDPQIIRQQIDNLKLLHPELLEDEESWLLSLESETDLTPLLRAINFKRKDADDLAIASALTIADYQHRKGRFERREQGLRELIFRLMQAAELKRLELPEATLTIAKGQPKVIITDEAAILAIDSLCRIRREVDKTRVKAMLTIGEAVAGAELSNAEPHLTVRVR